MRLTHGAPGALETGTDSRQGTGVCPNAAHLNQEPDLLLIYPTCSDAVSGQGREGQEGGSSQPKPTGTSPGEMQKPGSMPEVTSRVQGTKKESGRNWLRSEKAR